MIKTAVILAAGLGSRLKEKTKNQPKGFLELEGISLIQRSIDNLLSVGIEQIYIGTGYLSSVYDEFSKNYPQIECVKSDNYFETSSMYTLYNMKNKINEDFLLLESDLLYEVNALDYLIDDTVNDVILASGKTNSNDEVYIQVDNNNLKNMSKSKNDLDSIHAELVGISKISKTRYKLMCETFKNQDNLKIDYEYIMVLTSRIKPFYVKKIEKLIWCEIDDTNHLNRALSTVLPKIKAKEMTKVKRNILLNPGPATTTNSVKYAQVVPDICPREKEFGDLMEYVSIELTSIVANPKKYTTVLFGGSGTAAVESVISSVVPSIKKILIVNNGSYGARMCQIAEAYDIRYIEFKSSPIKPINIKKLKKVIYENNDISHLAVIHNETTTGLLNNLNSLGKLSKKFGLEFIVDAMSSYAAIPIDMKKQNIHYLIASSNKNIQGMAGIGFVISNNKSLKKLENIKPRNFYLNLFAQYNNFMNSHQMRFTPPVQTLYSLKQAIVEAKEEGIKNRYKRYSKSWKVLTNKLNEMNLKYLVDNKYHSKIITSIYIPEGIDFEEMHDYFYKKGYTIYPGKISGFNTFRIANIGEIDYKDMEDFLILFKKYLG